MQTQYYAGWDGGGTKTLCRVLYQDGTAPQPFTAGALNPNGTVAGQCEATVADLLRNMAALPGGLAACRMLCIGAAGISNPATRVHLQIVEKAGRELALLVRPVAEKLGLQSARIAFAGSVLQKCAPVRSAAQTQLQTLLPQLTLAEPQGDAAAGAVLLARCKAEE